MLIPERFYEENQIKSIQINEKFYSKNNDVYFIKAYREGNIPWNLAVKFYKRSRYSFNKEVDLLRHLREYEVMVPDIYFTSNNLIIMEYIAGEIMLDRILSLEESEVTCSSEEVYQTINQLAQWLLSFYQAMRKWKKRLYVKEDVNLRNFIYSQGKIYGIDFENTHPGVIEADVGKLCAFLLTYTPEFTEWRCSFTEKLIRIFSRELLLDTEVVIRAMRKEITVIAHRRKTSYSMEVVNKIIDSWRRERMVYKVL